MNQFRYNSSLFLNFISLFQKYVIIRYETFRWKWTEKSFSFLTMGWPTCGLFTIKNIEWFPFKMLFFFSVCLSKADQLFVCLPMWHYLSIKKALWFSTLIVNEWLCIQGWSNPLCFPFHRTFCNMEQQQFPLFCQKNPFFVLVVDFQTIRHSQSKVIENRNKKGATIVFKTNVT